MTINGKSAPNAERKKTIVLVHSDEWFGNILKDTFSSYGHEGIYLNSANEALSLIPSLSRPGSIAFIDWNMTAPNGVELIETLIKNSFYALKKVFIIPRRVEDNSEVETFLKMKEFRDKVELFEINSENMVKLFLMLDEGTF